MSPTQRRILGIQKKKADLPQCAQGAQPLCLLEPPPHTRTALTTRIPGLLAGTEPPSTPFRSATPATIC